MFIELFPSTLFLVKVKNHEKIKKECLDYVVPEYEKNPSTFVDACDADVWTTFNQENNFDWKNIVPLYIDELKDFSMQMGIFGNPMVREAWLNAYKVNQHQEIHEHLPGHFSCIHYVSYDKEEHSPTIFVNPFRQVALSNSPNFVGGADGTPATWVGQSFVKAEEGDLLIFPSFLEHKVPKQKSDKLRVTLSFNLNFVS